MTPSNTGASADADNTVTVKIDATRPDGHLPDAAARVRPERPRRPGLGDRDRRDSPVLSPRPISGPAIVTSAGAQTIDLTGEDKAGNTTTESCAYIVAYKFLGFDEPLPAEHRKAGSTIPVKFRLGDANDVPIPDAEAAALAAACEVQVFFYGGRPEPELRRVQGGAEPLRLPAQDAEGRHRART